jgi:hypothetical protein
VTTRSDSSVTAAYSSTTLRGVVREGAIPVGRQDGAGFLEMSRVASCQSGKPA